MTENQFKEKLIRNLTSISESLKSINSRLTVLDSIIIDNHDYCQECENLNDVCICPLCTRNKYDHRYFKERDFFKRKETE